jgi:hypothetical protein
MPSKQQKRANKNEQKQQEQIENQRVQEEEALWEQGTNKRGILKSQLQNEKQEEKMRLKQEKKELYEQETELLGPGKKSKSKKSKKDDLSLLNQVLSSAPKTKADLQKELEQKEKEERKKIEEQRAIEKEEQKQRELQQEKELKYKNMVKQDVFETMEKDVVGTIDDALAILDSSDDILIHKDQYKHFYDKQLILLKEENPNLRKNQYQEHIYKLWKRSPENPNNF